MVQLNAPHAHSDKWNLLDNAIIVNMFTDTFGNDATILPGQFIINELRTIGIATLELLENRTMSSIYRIRQTGVVYQVESMTGDIFDYDDYDCYLADDPIDMPVTIFSTGQMPNYTVVRIDADTLYILRNNPPKFAATWKNGEIKTTGMDCIDAQQIAKYMRRIGLMVDRFLKDERKN